MATHWNFQAQSLHQKRKEKNLIASKMHSAAQGSNKSLSLANPIGL